MRAHHVTRRPAALAVAALLCACQGGRSEVDRIHVAGGSAERGAAVISEIGCGACHTIPGIEDAQGTVGPPLIFWSRRSYIAGSLPNAPENLVRWVRAPSSVEPGTAMPTLGLSEQQARDVAAYLYTLDRESP